MTSNNGQIKFEIGEYDKSQTLTIEPILSYLNYIGGTGFNDVAKER